MDGPQPPGESVRAPSGEGARLRGAVLGLGMIGRHHARILQSTPGVEFAGAVDPGGDRFRAVHDPQQLYTSLDDLLRGGPPDFAVVAVPLRPETEGLLGERELEALGPTGYLVNVARGAIVDEDALYAALVSGRLSGAGLDVHAVEPRAPDDRFCALSNVILTPHVSGGSRTGTMPELAQIYDNLRRVA